MGPKSKKKAVHNHPEQSARQIRRRENEKKSKMKKLTKNMKYSVQRLQQAQRERSSISHANAAEPSKSPKSNKNTEVEEKADEPCTSSHQISAPLESEQVVNQQIHGSKSKKNKRQDFENVEKKSDISAQAKDNQTQKNISENEQHSTCATIPEQQTSPSDAHTSKGKKKKTKIEAVERTVLNDKRSNNQLPAHEKQIVETSVEEKSFSATGGEASQTLSEASLITGSDETEDCSSPCAKEIYFLKIADAISKQINQGKFEQLIYSEKTQVLLKELIVTRHIIERIVEEYIPTKKTLVAQDEKQNTSASERDGTLTNFVAFGNIMLITQDERIKAASHEAYFEVGSTGACMFGDKCVTIIVKTSPECQVICKVGQNTIQAQRDGESTSEEEFTVVV